MKAAVLLATVLLAGCSTVVTQKSPFPEAPESLLAACPELKLVQDGTTSLSKVLSVVTDNYAEYHACRAKVDAWIDWHKRQTEIANKNN
jgi:uncharacterized protein YceK